MKIEFGAHALCDPVSRRFQPYRSMRPGVPAILLLVVVPIPAFLDPVFQFQSILPYTV